MRRLPSHFYLRALAEQKLKVTRLEPNKAFDEILVLELRGVTCHMGSHSVTCHPTQVNESALNPATKLVLDLTTLEGWKAELVGYPAMHRPSRTRDLSITSPTP